MPRALAVRRAEEHRPVAAAIRDKALLEHVRVVEARMQQRDALADRRRRGLLSGDELLEQPVDVVDLSAAVREVGHVAQDPSLGLRLNGEVDGLGAEEVGHAPVRLVDAAALVGHRPVLRGELALVRG